MTEMTLDYATLFETEIRPRQRRRAMLRMLGAVALALTPVLTVMVLGAG